MPILEQGYEPYRGVIRRSNLRFLSIAVATLRRHHRWWMWGLFVMSVICAYFLPTIRMFGAYVVVGLAGPQEAALNSIRMSFVEYPGFHSGAISGSVFWAILMSAAVGAGEVAEDMRSGGLVFYLGRSVTRTDYLLGKTFAVSAVVAGVTLVPFLALFTVQALFEGNMTWLRGHWKAVPAAFAFTLILAFSLSGFVLGASAIARRRLFATVGIVGLFMAALTSALVLAPPLEWTAGSERRAQRAKIEKSLQDAKTREEREVILTRRNDGGDELGSGTVLAEWRALSPPATFQAVARTMFGDPLPSNFRGGWHWLLACVVPAVFYMILWRKVRAVEVVT